MVAKAVLLKQAIDRANSTSLPNTADSRFREKGMNKFALRCFNSLSQDREVSGVQVASTILQLPSYYTLNYNFTRIHLGWLKRYVRSLIHQGHHQDAPISSESIEEEPCHYGQSSKIALSTIFDNYKLTMVISEDNNSHAYDLSLWKTVVQVSSPVRNRSHTVLSLLQALAREIQLMGGEAIILAFGIL